MNDFIKIIASWLLTLLTGYSAFCYGLLAIYDGFDGERMIAACALCYVCRASGAYAVRALREVYSG